MGLFGLGRDGLGPFTGYLFGRSLEKELKKQEKKERKKLQQQAKREALLSAKDNIEDVSWRHHCEDGSEYGLDPADFDTKAEYDEALYEEKYSWREAYVNDADVLKYGLNVNTYETEDALLEALDSKEIEDDELNGWRELYINDPDVIKYGLDPNDYETEDDLCDAIDARADEEDE